MKQKLEHFLKNEKNLKLLAPNESIGANRSNGKL